jgi:hypothetical protein
MKLSESLQKFLNARKSPANQDLLARWHIGMETQANMMVGDGELVAGKRTTWSNGTETWHNFRIPHGANSDPQWDDYDIRFPLDTHCEGIGMTGWDWQKRCSVFVGFDVDSITSHAKGIGISDADLEKVKEAAGALPYIETRRSTGGSGLHLYAYLDNIPTLTHTEHSALARCILGMMSSDCNFPFASQVDACGQIMWCWHRKMLGTKGLEIITPSKKLLTASDLPANWKDHIEVVTKQRTKIRINEITESNQDPFETLASSRKIIPLDDSHKAQIDELQRSGFTTLWVPDHHLLQTHTKALEELMGVKDLKLIGYFKTISQGNHPGTPNCFLFPLLDGSWKVYRFSPGINEAETWTQDSGGWTTCYFNRKPNLKAACLLNNGVEDTDGGFGFTNANDALNAAKLLGQTIKLDPDLEKRQVILKTHKDGRLIVQIEKKKDDKPIDGWLAKKNKGWVRVFETKTEPEEEASGEFDKIIRAVFTPAEKFEGWYKNQSGRWLDEPSQNIKMLLQSLGQSKTAAEEIMGEAISKEWELVCLPFQPEYTGDRQWNRGSAQLRYKPADLDGEEPSHPYWDTIYNHVGQELTPVLATLQWAIDAGIKTGGDYLRAWTACVFRYPFEPLPYLFLHGDEESGKSIFWESLDVLITKGVVRADKALTSQSGFNGELAGAIICAVDEIDVSKYPGAAAKIRDACTGKTLSIRKMRTDAFDIPNTTHWIQAGNNLKMCPIPPGDTRVTVCRVPAPETDIPKLFFLEKLREEAPHFMYTLMTLTLPPVIKRLRLPVVTTDSKLQALNAARDTLERFIATQCTPNPDNLLRVKDFCDSFLESLSPEDRAMWPKARILSEFPTQFSCVEGHSNTRYFAGLELK